MAKSLRALHWNESKHPRDDRGRFSRKGGASWASKVLGQFEARFGDTSMAQPGGDPRERGRLQTGSGGLLDISGMSKAAKAKFPRVEKLARGTFERGPSSATSSNAGVKPMVEPSTLKSGDRIRYLGAELEVTGEPRKGRQAGRTVHRVPVRRVADGKTGPVTLSGPVERVEAPAARQGRTPGDGPFRGATGGAAARMEALRERAGIGRAPGGTVDKSPVPVKAGGVTEDIPGGQKTTLTRIPASGTRVESRMSEERARQLRESTDPKDNGKKLMAAERGDLDYADLYRTAVAGPSGQRRAVHAGRVRYTPDNPSGEYRVTDRGGDTVGWVSSTNRDGRHVYSVYSENYDGGTELLGWADSVAHAADVLTNGETAASGSTARNSSSRRISGNEFARNPARGKSVEELDQEAAQREVARAREALKNPNLGPNIRAAHERTIANGGISAPMETAPKTVGPSGAIGDPIPKRDTPAYNRAIGEIQILGPGHGDRTTPYLSRAPEPGDLVTAGGLNRKGTIVRAIRRNRTDGFDVQWEGSPYTSHYSASQLRVVDVETAIKRNREREAIGTPEAPEKVPPKRLQTFAERMAGDLSESDRRAARVAQDERMAAARAREAEFARQATEAAANDTRTEREKLNDLLREQRAVRDIGMRSGRVDPKREARIKTAENRLAELDTEDRKAKAKEFEKGDKVKTLIGEFEVTGKDKEGYLRVVRPDGRKGRVDPKNVESVTKARAVETPSAGEQFAADTRAALSSGGMNVGRGPVAGAQLPGTARREAAAGTVQAATDALKAATTRAEGDAAVADLKGADLRLVAEKLNINIGGMKVADAKQRIVEATIGARLNSAAIRDRSNYRGVAYLGGAGRSPGGGTSTGRQVSAKDLPAGHGLFEVERDSADEPKFELRDTEGRTVMTVRGNVSYYVDRKVPGQRIVASRTERQGFHAQLSSEVAKRLGIDYRGRSSGTTPTRKEAIDQLLRTLERAGYPGKA